MSTSYGVNVRFYPLPLLDVVVLTRVGGGERARRRVSKRRRRFCQAVCRPVYLYSMAHQQPDRDDIKNVAGWRCPLCNSNAYSQVSVVRPNRTTYKTEFFECSGCTVMFHLPGRFTRLGLQVRRWASDVEPRSLRDVHGFAREPEANLGAAPTGQLRDGKG
jgi:hypothetical protein